jgi:hypothetical protein
VKVNINTKYQRGAAATFIDLRLAKGYSSFSLEELMRRTDLSIVAANNQLKRLGSKVVRVAPKQPYFLIVTPSHLDFGAPPVEWWLDDYFEWLNHPYYLALQSAAEAYGSSQQAIQLTQVITDTPRRDITLGRIRVRFFMKSGIGKTITQQMPNARAPLSVSTPETTIYDLVRYAHSIGGIERVAETIEPMLKDVKASNLLRVLRAEDEITTTQRLGFVLEALGADKLADVSCKWLPRNIQLIPIATHYKTDKSASVNKRWSVINNTKVFHV